MLLALLEARYTEEPGPVLVPPYPARVAELELVVPAIGCLFLEELPILFELLEFLIYYEMLPCMPGRELLFATLFNAF